MGKPNTFQLVELGPGRGTLTEDILRVGENYSFSLCLGCIPQLQGNLKGRCFAVRAYPSLVARSLRLAAQTPIGTDEFLGPGLSGGSRTGPACAHCTDTPVTFQTPLDRRGGQDYSIGNYFCVGKRYPNWKPSRKVLLCVTGMETLVQGTERGSTITQNEIVLIPLGISRPYSFELMLCVQSCLHGCLN